MNLDLDLVEVEREVRKRPRVPVERLKQQFDDEIAAMEAERAVGAGSNELGRWCESRERPSAQ